MLREEPVMIATLPERRRDITRWSVSLDEQKMFDQRRDRNLLDLKRTVLLIRRDGASNCAIVLGYGLTDFDVGQNVGQRI